MERENKFNFPNQILFTESLVNNSKSDRKTILMNEKGIGLVR